MSEATNSQSSNNDHCSTIEIDGIEIFDVPSIAGHLPGNAGHPPDTETLPLAEAMIRLNLSERSIRRKLKAGKLESAKDNSGRLLIICPAPPGITPVIPPDNAGHPPELARQTPDNDRLWQLVQDQASKIEILTTRNGYLQHQIESQREQIKLLTDSQYKPSWWLRLKNLFLVEPKRLYV